MVGDPNQAIYGWNGADPSLLGRITELVEGVEVVHLGENHRSSPQVVAAAAAALGPVVPAPPPSAAPDGPRPVVTAYDDPVAEAEGIASVLSERHADGVPWRDQAVLARTHDQLVEIGRALAAVGIPFTLAAGAARPDAGRAAWADPDRTEGAVELATFHRAKGLEWTSVCVAGVEEGYVPIVHAATDESVAEERRLLYVALDPGLLRPALFVVADQGDRVGPRRRAPSLPLALCGVAGGDDRDRASSGHSEGVRRVAALRAALRGTTPSRL